MTSKSEKSKSETTARESETMTRDGMTGDGMARKAMTGEEIVELCRRHTLFEWSAQAAVDPIPVARAKG
ncbi:MAG: hypothetical protein ABR556_12375, partial [Pyrinomonadaceae bacterium]